MTQWGLDTLFNPAKRHMDEEKQRLQSTREEVGDNSGGKRIDLESGRVVIARHDPADDEDAGKAGRSRGRRRARAGREADAVAEPVAEKSKHEPTAAQIRAAKRRGRDL